MNMGPGLISTNKRSKWPLSRKSFEENPACVLGKRIILRSWKACPLCDLLFMTITSKYKQDQTVLIDLHKS